MYLVPGGVLSPRDVSGPGGVLGLVLGGTWSGPGGGVWSGGYLVPGGCTWSGLGGVPGLGGVCQVPPPDQTRYTPPVNRITDRCKNITLAQLRCGR